MTRFPHVLRNLVGPALASLVLGSCFGGGSSLTPGQSANAGAFQVEAINMNEGDVWALNRPIVLTFNHPIDPNSVGFSSVIIRPVSSAVLGRPVTGSFEVRPGTGGKVLVFRPACPTNSGNDNGAFVPGGYSYEIALPTQSSFGASVLRDQSGHALSVGVRRGFRSPIDPVEPLFLDTQVGPPRFAAVDPVVFPDGLNLFTDLDPIIEIRFNQSVEASADNLNTDRLYVLYSDGEIGSGQENTFSATNKLPGQLLLVDNCTSLGALIYFQIAGILPPNRNLVVRVSSEFADLAGETNSQVLSSALHATPTLTVYYQGDPNWSESDETVDEVQESFATSTILDAAAALAFPAADFALGKMTASFDYPGQPPSSAHDLVLRSFSTLDLVTTGTMSFQDSNGRSFQIVDGVLEVDDLTIEEDALMRARGNNPLMIYATGTVSVLGVLDASGDHALTPQALSQPTVPEPGALGGPGGGTGGDASWETTKETLRGGAGTGAFKLGLGGGGGEGCVNWTENGAVKSSGRSQIAGGGAGGQFAAGTNLAVQWDRWNGQALPDTYDNAGPDVRADRHTHFATQANIDSFFLGAEDGLRGNSWRSTLIINEPVASPSGDPDFGGYGMEDAAIDTVVQDNPGLAGGSGFDPAWTNQADPPFKYGHPSNGPDEGFAEDPVFSGSINNDFTGSRWNAYTSTRLEGELTAPWAGAGGGASGDSDLVWRLDLDADNFLDPFATFFPDTNFPSGWTFDYWKGAPGGGGGGQLQILAIGPIILGPNTQLLANGGAGTTGESTGLGTTNLIYQVSGSGGGSGGHIILQSATGLDLSSVNVGTDPVNSPPATLPELAQAIGGRRGWAYSDGVKLQGGVTPDGNSDFMIGRGGAGANGVIQVHVPEPAEDIAWHANAATAIRNYVHHNNLTGPLDADRLEEMLDLYFEPRPFALIPAISPKSQFQTVWIDTGLAGLRDPIPANDYPNYASSLLAFAGVSTSTGEILAANSVVTPLAEVATGSTIGAAFSAQQVVIPNAASTFLSAADRETMLRNPALLVGYDVLPDSAGSSAFEVTQANYSRALDRLTLTTLSADGSMLLAVNPGNPVWSLRPKFFRLTTSGQKDRLPSSASVKFEFQGAAESSAGSNEPGTPSAWTSDLADLEGLRFIRYRVTFDIDAGSGGVSVNSERPSLEYVKIPLVW